MDASRRRRTRDRARRAWYARYRQERFARYLGFGLVLKPMPVEAEALGGAGGFHAARARAEGC